MNPETKLVSFPADGHPDENQLLLALERELSADESVEIERHVGQCWNCRARSEEMQRGILAFVEYREKRYLPSLKPPPNDHSGFSGQLRSVAGEKPRIGVLARIWHRLIAILSFPGHLRWASVVAGGMALVLFWTEILHPPVISANELLTRAAAAQNPPASSQTAMRVRIARQKLQIRSERQTVVRDFEWVVGRPVEQANWGWQPDPLHWATPLTAEGFALWRDSLKENSDKVKRSNDFFTIETIASHAFIREASMVVRANDFHPVEQHLRFADNRHVDLKEIAFEILDQPKETQRPVAPLEKAQTVSRKSPQPEPAHPTKNLDETELQLRYTLHTHQWGLREDLLIERGPDKVILSGIVSSEARRAAMETALIGLPNVQLVLRAPGAISVGTSPSRPASGTRRQDPASDPILKAELSQTFPSGDERQAFVDRCLAVSDTALSHAWMLKRLADRYSPEAEQRLSPASQAKLREILRVHLDEISRANAGLQPLVDMLPASYNRAPVSILNWRSGILSLFAQVQEQDAIIATLVVGTHATFAGPTAAAEMFRANHQSIDATVGGSLRKLARDGTADGRR